MNYKHKYNNGFTIMELLVVIVVIAILAAIGAVGYSGVLRTAVVATLTSDLSQASDMLELENVENHIYPSNINDCPTPTDGNVCLSRSPGTVYQYTLSGGDYCITATNKNIAYMLLSEDRKPIEGVCAGHNPPTGSALPSYSGQTILGWTSNNLTSMLLEESSFGIRNGMTSTFVDFAGASAFPVTFADKSVERQAAVLISWEPSDMTNDTSVQPLYKPTLITAGNFDTYITNWLQTAQSYADDIAVMVRFAPEMNDGGLAWSIGENGGNTNADYINMWKHVYAIKESVAPDVIFVWNPLNYGSSPSSYADLYPGSAFVDLLAIDGFNWSDVRNPGTCRWQGYEDIFKDPNPALSPTEKIKTLAAGKPWGIAEVASAPDNPTYFNVGGVCYGGWSWVYTYPENPPYEQVPSDWITQDGWTKMLLKKAHADGALFVNIFNVHKASETDWRVNDTSTGIDAIHGAATSGGWVSGDQNASGYIKSALQ